MGIKKNPRPSVTLKDSSKRYSHHNKSRIKPQIKKHRIVNRKKTKLSLPSKGAKAMRFKPLAKLFNRGGMAYGRRSILRTTHNDYQLRRKFLMLGIRSRKGVEDALLELLFQCRNLKDWDSGGDNLVDVFRLIKGRVKWASSLSVDLIMQLFFTVLRARLDCPANLRKTSCKVALRVDKVISVSVPKALYLISRMTPVMSRCFTAAFVALLRCRDSLRFMVRPENLPFNTAFMSVSTIGDLRADLRSSVHQWS